MKHMTTRARRRSIRKRAWSFRWLYGLIGKGRFIREQGREAWEILRANHPDAIVRDGKRAYVTQEAYLDNLWMAPPCP